ncbi:MAG: class I SAM-dependent methyltransferase [Geobacteraceae bacterium]|nr:class I SAM-dependent methyltransferase [Geobacteraceae bacterium]
MKDWLDHWHEFPAGMPEAAFFEQVGKTVNRKPVPEEFIGTIVSSIRYNLLLEPNDYVLDLCCGNGLLTKIVAEHCLFLTGIDYSDVLIHVANKYNRPDNVTYVLGDVLNIRSLVSNEINKLYMYEAMQHFTSSMLSQLLDELLFVANDKPLIFFVGSVPDRSKLWKFYNTLWRKLNYYWKSFNKEEAIGTWWEKGSIASICKKKNLRVHFIDQNPMLHTAHYRFDMLITNCHD